MSTVEEFIEMVTDGDNDLGAYFDGKDLVQTVWDHRQKEIYRLKKENEKLKGALELFCNDCECGVGECGACKVFEEIEGDKG